MLWTPGLLAFALALHPEFARNRGWKTLAKELAALDWSRTAKMWQGTLVREGRVVMEVDGIREAAETARAAVVSAREK